MAGRKIRWQGEGLHEEGIDETTEKVVVVINPSYYRPTEVETLLGDPKKAKKELGWVPDIAFEELIYDMMNHDFRRVGLELPESAMNYIPDGRLTRPLCYPDLGDSRATGDTGKFLQMFSERIEGWNNMRIRTPKGVINVLPHGKMMFSC